MKFICVYMCFFKEMDECIRDSKSDDEKMEETGANFLRFRRCMVRDALANGTQGERKWGGATLVTSRRTSIELHCVYERAPLQLFTLIAATILLPQSPYHTCHATLPLIHG